MKVKTGTRKSTAIFDLDGTLVDSMPFVIESFVHAVEPFTGPLTPAEVLAQLGGPIEACLRNLLGPQADQAIGAAKERFLKYEHGQEGKLLPFAGAKELLGSLRSHGVKLGIWTGRDRWSAERIMEIHQLKSYFGAVVCGDDLPSHKPDPAGLFQVIEKLGVKPDEAIFMGDADVDVLAGHEAKVHTILVHHGRVAAAHIHSRAAEIFREPGEAYAAAERHFN